MSTLANDGTVKIGVDFSNEEVKKGFEKLRKEAQKTGASLKEIDNALKLNPSNTDLLIEKQKLLTNAIANAEKQAAALNKEFENAKVSGLADKNADAYRKLAIAVSNAEATTKAYIDDLEEVNHQLNKMDKQLESVGDELTRAKKDSDGFASSLSKAGNAAKIGFGATVKAIGSVATAAGGAITGLLALESATEEYRIAQGKLNTAFEVAGYSSETAKKAYTDFYKILGDTDTAAEASQLLAKLAQNESDMSTWTNIAAGVWGTFGDALPIEGLIEAANETAKVGRVTGTLADALNWAGISEDEFNKKLESLSTESERNQLIMDTLASTYNEAADAFYRNNESIIQARENQALLDETLAKLGQTVSNVKTSLLSEFLPSLSKVVSAFTDMASGVEGADEALGSAITDMVTALVEKLPDFLSFGVDIIKSILKGIIDNLPSLLDGAVQIIQEIATALVELAPSLLKAGGEMLYFLANGIKEGLPNFIAAIPEVIQSLLDYITENMPTILEKGVEIINAIVNGIIFGISELVAALPEIIQAISDFLSENSLKIAVAGVEIVLNLIAGIISAIPQLAVAALDLVWTIIDSFGILPDEFIQVGKDLIAGLWKGVEEATSWLMENLSDFADWVIGGIKDFFGIHSPSDETEWMGEMLDEGLVCGIKKGAGKIKDAIKALDIKKELESVIPSIEQKVSLATSAMAPAAVYETIAQPHPTGAAGKEEQQQNEKTSNQVTLVFEGSMAQLARVMRPYMVEEDGRVGKVLVKEG